MAASQPGPRYTGLWYDPVNNRLAFYFRGTLVKYINATTEVESSGITLNLAAATMTEPTANRVQVVRLGSVAAVASNGADAIAADVGFVAPYDLQIVAAWGINISASDVTKGTATSSASYRRANLITNTAGTGSGTNIVASLNATASLASNATRAFTTVASTVPQGAIVLLSHLTVGAQTADGTDSAARIYEAAYIKV